MEERLEYRIKNDGYDQGPDFIKITKDQLRLLDWLIDFGYLVDVSIEQLGEIEFREI